MSKPGHHLRYIYLSEEGELLKAPQEAAFGKVPVSHQEMGLLAREPQPVWCLCLQSPLPSPHVPAPHDSPPLSCLCGRGACRAYCRRRPQNHRTGTLITSSLLDYQWPNSGGEMISGIPVLHRNNVIVILCPFSAYLIFLFLLR